VNETPEREWWQTVTDVAFKNRLASMELFQLHELGNDIAAAVVKIQSQLQSGNPDADWNQRANHALLSCVARRRWLKAELNSRHAHTKTANHERRRRNVAELRALLGSGDVVGCLQKMIDQIDPDLIR
jgi:hypothetical protein